MEQALVGEERKEDELDPIEQGELDDARRTFTNNLRPDNQVWNFFDENEESKVAHVLRANANPIASYIDNRVYDLIIVIEGMGQHIKVFNAQSWNYLNSMVFEIFKRKEDETIKKMAAYEEALAKEKEEAARNKLL